MNSDLGIYRQYLRQEMNKALARSRNQDSQHQDAYYQEYLMLSRIDQHAMFAVERARAQRRLDDAQPAEATRGG